MSSVKLEQRGPIFILTLTGNDENRPDATMLPSFHSALAEIKSKASNGSALITMAHCNFFSQIYDGYAQTEFWLRKHGPSVAADELVRNFIVLPMPSVAIVTGEVMKGVAAVCGIVMLQACHDHVIVRSEKGGFFVNTLDSGMSLADFVMAQKKGPEVVVEKNPKSSPKKEGIIDVILHNLVDKLSEMVGDEDKAEFRNDIHLDAVVHNIVEKCFVPKKDEEKAEFRKALYLELRRVLGLASIEALVSKL